MSARQPRATVLVGFPLRLARPDDRAGVERFLAAMDSEGRYQRHFAHGDVPNQALLDRLDILDNRQRVAVLALAATGEVVGHAEYAAEFGAAEFGILVLPHYRASGIGTGLLQALLGIASEVGQTRMHGSIQAVNRRALQLVRRNGFAVVPGDDARVVIVSRNLPPSRAPCPASTDTNDPTHLIRHDFDRTSLHRCLGSRAPLRAGGGEVQCVAADIVGGGEKTRGRTRHRAFRTQFG